jgi:ankyrin repeat protein
MGFSLSKIFNWMKPKQETPAAPAPPPPPPVLDLPNLYQQSEADIIKYIQEQLAAGATLKGTTALNKVCSQGWLNAATFLLDAGVDINNPRSSNYIHPTTPFHCAAGSGNPELIAELIKRGARTDALYGEAKDQHNALYAFFLDRGMYRDFSAPESRARDIEAFKILLGLGLDKDPVLDHFVYNHRPHLAPLVPDVDKAMKFENAVRAKDYETVCGMIADGMHPDVGATYSGPAALAIAAGGNDLKMMGILMANGAEVNKHSRLEDALHAAARGGAEEAFAKLVGAGADTDKLYTYDRYPDTNITEVAGYCKEKPGMVDFVKNALARKQELKTEYEATKETFLHPYAHLSVSTEHTVAVHKPLKLKLRTSAA